MAKKNALQTKGPPWLSEEEMRQQILSLGILPIAANPSFFWLVVSNIFYFHPYLGKIPILANIFQRGWNHQPIF